MDLHKVRLEWAMLIPTAGCAEVATTSMRDIIRKSRTAAAAVRATPVSSTSTRATVPTSLLESSRLCDIVSPTTFLVITCLCDTSPLVITGLGHARTCVCADCRTSELLNGRRGLGDLIGRLTLGILI